jgi:hypothetical protein
MILSEIVLLYPIDLVKVRYQVYDKTGNAYTSLKDAFKTIIRDEGFTGLYQVRLASRNASSFTGIGAIDNCICSLMGWLLLFL